MIMMSHTDHQIICKAVLSMIKWFRYPYIAKVLMYETLSETDFNLGQQNSFKPNTYVDISNYIDKKIKAMSIYESEIESFPFLAVKRQLNLLQCYVVVNLDLTLRNLLYLSTKK